MWERERLKEEKKLRQIDKTEEEWGLGQEFRQRDVIAARGWHFITKQQIFVFRLNWICFLFFFCCYFFPFSGWTFFNLYLMCVSEWFYINLFLSFTCTDIKESSSARARLDFFLLTQNQKWLSIISWQHACFSFKVTKYHAAWRPTLTSSDECLKIIKHSSTLYFLIYFCIKLGGNWGFVCVSSDVKAVFGGRFYCAIHFFYPYSN